MRILKRLLGGLCALTIAINAAPEFEIFSEAEAQIDEASQSEVTDTTDTVSLADDYTDNEPQFMFTLPDNMRATIITPAVDFCLDGTTDSAAVTAELEEIFANFSEIGLNTVIINTVFEDGSYYSLDMNNDDIFDPTSLAVSTAYNYGISPYVVMDLSHLLADCTDGTKQIDTLISKVHRFALKYPCDGIILDDYYLRRSTETFGSYMDNGSGIGYTNWLYDTAEQFFSTAADIIHMTNNSIAVGFMINDMWANSSSNPDGSETADSVQALYDGYSDTKSFIEKNYVDFALLRAYGSLTDGMLPFETVTGWWGSLMADYDMPMYIVHYNEKIGTEYTGWGAEDQLLRQLSVSKDIDSYKGSVFNSYERLMQNPMGTTSTLTSYFNEQINEESLFEDLQIISPAKLSFTTSEPSVTFMGSFDSNFPVYFNNSPIQLNDAGNYYFTKDLKVGMNTFTITHKSKTYTYKIERKIVVMKSITKSISEGKTLQVDGGTKINLSVKAYKGSEIYGMVNGQKVPMKETEKTNEDEDDANSYYVRYKGTYTVPDGIIGQEQNLGTIKIYGSNSGYSMEVIGATVIVNAKPQPVIKHEAEMSDANSVGTGEVIGTLESIYKESDSVTYVKTSSDYTIVYDGKTADDIQS
ncbi:MAG: N-acetylmuramoyl-L-alanine amidase, partial [Ruminiclostridium sp.]|nr:N-acetylmuramoyl-L-alanine amidase [Ruminiclostridium sp.]